MPTVLTVDDTTEIRAAVARMLRAVGVEVLEAGTGAEALELLSGTSVDLILLDVMMPVMDGPTMLRELRARGDQTPVILVTSESSRQLVAGALQLGISDYILKPFRPDGLRSKVARALETSAPPSRAPAPQPAATAEPARAAAPAPVAPVAPVPNDVPPPPAAPPPADVATAAPPPATASTAPSIDLLVIDDMEQVHRRLRQALPADVSMHAATDAGDAVMKARQHAYRLVLLDLVIPEVDSLALLQQLRGLQPQASFLALTLRTTAPALADLQAAGFVDLVHKPLGADAAAELVQRVQQAR